MRNKIVWVAISLALCVLSGIVGAYSVARVQSRRAQETLQIRRLELTDAHNVVRAAFAVESDGSVYLQMLSRYGAPVVQLGVSEDAGPYEDYKAYTPSGRLIISDGSGTPAIDLRTVGKGEGHLVFSSTNIEGIVSVGYEPVGDVRDQVDRGGWGIQVRGPDHTAKGLGVYTEDGVMRGFEIPLKPMPRGPRK